MPFATIILALAIAAVWLPNFRFGRNRSISPALLLLGIALVAGLNGGQIDWGGMAAILLLVVLATYSRKSSEALIRRSFAFLAIALAFALGSRLMPGFSDILLIEGVRLTPDAGPVRLTAHFDVGATGLILLLIFCRRSQNLAEAIDAILKTIPIGLITTGAVITLGCLVGYVRPDLKLPSFTALYLVKTWLWTAVLEESFFRGVIQERLASSRFVISRPAVWWLPVAASSVLFGFAHARGGWTYVCLATLAGLGYGIAYSKTRKIEAAIFAHFLLNSVHFIGFTYPYLERQ
jgi:membrane protease YdiL (CAAX protease family)